MNIGAKLTLKLMSYSFAGKTNLVAFFKAHTFMFSKLVGWNKFHTSFTFPFFLTDCMFLSCHVRLSE